MLVVLDARAATAQAYDPYELRNLADDPTPVRHRQALKAELARLLRQG